MQLDPNKIYLRTDATTALACFVYATSKFDATIPISQSLVTFGDSHTVSGLRFGDAELELEEIPGRYGGKAVLVAHLKGLLPEGKTPVKLTRSELEKLISGYPPLYREKFRVRPSAPPIT